MSILVGLLALSIAGLTIWLCYDVLAHPVQSDTPRSIIMAILYAVGVLAVALGVFGLRFLVPRLRVENGKLIGWRGLAAFGILYGLLLIISLVQRNPQAKRAALLLAFGVALGAALRAMFGKRAV